MAAFKKIDEVIFAVKGLPGLLPSDRDALIRTLNSFRQISLADQDRQPNMSAVGASWQELEAKLERVGVHERFKSRPEFWFEIRDAFSAPRFTRTSLKVIEPVPSKYEKWTVEDFLQQLIYDVRDLKFHNKEERSIVTLGLKHLKSEASRNRDKQDHKSIRETWMTLHPLLQKYSVLNPYRKELSLKTRMSFFLKNGF